MIHPAPAIPTDIFCRTCGYCLTGASEPRCAECGQPFDPTDPRTYRTTARRLRWPSALTAPVISLLTLWFLVRITGTIEIYLAALSVSLLWLLTKKRIRAAIAVIAFSPTTLLSIIVCVQYFTGRAALHGQYLSHCEMASVDPVDRTPRRLDYGDLVSPTDWFWIDLKDEFLRVAVNLFGPVPGTYLGPFPTRAAAINALSTAVSISADEYVADRVVLPKRTYQLAPGIGEQLLYQTEWYYANADQRVDVQASAGAITAVELPPSLLVVRIPSVGTPSGMRAYARIALIDVRSGRAFALYYESCENNVWLDHVPSYTGY